MIEAYAFLAAFAVQVLVVSVLYPAWLIRYMRMQATTIPAERLAQLYPGIDFDVARERFLTRYRALSAGIAVLGLLLWSWLFSDMRRPDWHEGSVEILITLYFLAAQMLPVGLVAWLGVRFNRDLTRSLPEGKRKAVLQRRGLFDFVSPFVVVVAVLGYFLFAGFVIYLRQHPFAGFAGLVNIGAITLVYAVNALCVYTMLYGKKPNPFEPHADRVHTIGRVVKGSVYSCIVVVVYLSLNFSLRLLHLEKWEPFALSVFLLLGTLLASMGFTAPLRKPVADGPGPASLH
jgi:hypothetical protein